MSDQLADAAERLFAAEATPAVRAWAISLGSLVIAGSLRRWSGRGSARDEGRHARHRAATQALPAGRPPRPRRDDEGSEARGACRGLLFPARRRL